MLILAMETAGETASVALTKDGRLLGEHTLHQVRTHSETMLPMAEALLAALGLMPEDIDAVAVDQGPGSFTGVRIGICAANAMGQALHIPVIGVPSLRILYERIAYLPMPVCAMMDARNDSVYAAVYQEGICLREPEALEVAALLPELPTGTICIGDGALAYADRIRTQAPRAIVAPEAAGILHAVALGSVAHSLLLAHGMDAYVEAMPLYLRPSQAERMWRQRPEDDNAQTTQ